MRDGNGHQVLDARGKPKMRELGAKCPKLSGKKAHGTWWYYINLEPGPDGKQRKDRRGGFTDKDAALEALAKVISQQARKEVIDHRTTVGEFLTKWLAGRKALEKTTLSSYSGHIRSYLIPALGNIKLEDLTAGPIRDMFDAIEARNLVIEYELAMVANARAQYAVWKAQYGRKPGRPKANALPPAVPAPEIPSRAPHPQMRVVSPASMHRIRATLRSALTQAAREERISKNWASLVELPSGKRPKALLWTPERVAAWNRTGEKPSKVMVWTPEQAGVFLDAIENDWLRAYWHLAIFRGLRRGEGAGLQKSKTSLETALITVDWQIVTVDGAPMGKTPKADSVRTIALDSHTLQELRDHFDRMDEARKEAANAGLPWPETDSVFIREDGAEINPNYLTDRFERLYTRIGLPPVRLHDLRHLAATLLLGAGADLKVVQEVLGHSTIAMTADTYTSVLPALDRDSAEKAAALVPMKNRRPTDNAVQAYVVRLGGIQVAIQGREDAETTITTWNSISSERRNGASTAEMPTDTVSWDGTGRLWDRPPRYKVIHCLIALIDRRTSTVLRFPLSTGVAWEFERELFTELATVTRIETPLGRLGPIEVTAHGTDREAVRGSFAQALRDARALGVIPTSNEHRAAA
ncbi:tyrosine-type recombinase/integrase [Kitasatospora sp. NPDC096147]|uniref:tyrosine-type recombinase/integrase n=1 Tax=Kitasatospora sp. NPDC096147 TaxID=3364093 RepID=UPI00381E2B4F